MANKVIQYRYYGEDNVNNYPSGAQGSAQYYINGTVFEKTTPILQLGIQTLPGVQFYLNKSAGDPIVIGSTGIYELDLQNKTEITHLRFSSESLNLIADLNKTGQYQAVANPNAYLIVDIVYEQTEVE